MVYLGIIKLHVPLNLFELVERSEAHSDESIFREEPIQEEISIHEAAKTGNEDALELSLRRGSGLTVTTLSPNILNKNIVDDTGPFTNR